MRMLMPKNRLIVGIRLFPLCLSLLLNYIQLVCFLDRDSKVRAIHFAISTVQSHQYTHGTSRQVRRR